MNEQEKRIYSIKLKRSKEFKNKEFTKSNNFLNSFYEDLNLREVKIINTLLYVFSTYLKLVQNMKIKKIGFLLYLKKRSILFQPSRWIKLIDQIVTNITLFELGRKSLEKHKKEIIKYIKFNDYFKV